MAHQITLLPQKRIISAEAGENLLFCLCGAGVILDSPCGGNGRCGKCKVTVDGKEALACKTLVGSDISVVIPQIKEESILTEGITPAGSLSPVRDGYLIAIDIGTTTVAGYLLEGESGRELATQSMSNPQAVYGADVISRIRHAVDGRMDSLTFGIRDCVEKIILALCANAGVHPDTISAISVVGNPAMQQLFLGLYPVNLTQIPFAPVLTQAKIEKADRYLPVCKNALMLTVPDISGFVGADMLACVLATELDRHDKITLLVDIGTNGEMVLGNRQRMVACSTAAGPALEGANIRFGMRGQAGAIDHVRIQEGKLCCSVIGRGKATGICGSGLIDAVARALDTGLLNARGRIQNEERRIALTDDIFLTQEDIREVQMAKGAIAAGIELMAVHLGISLEDVDQVYLAGAFGSFMDPESACRIGLLPAALRGKIKAVGNAAGSGAKLLACYEEELDHTQQLVSRIEYLELATVPAFERYFARNMRF